MTDGLVEHLERHLGTICRGYSTDDVQVSEFWDAPSAGANTFVTLGLSRHILIAPSGRHLRQEMVATVAREWDAGAVAGFLATMAGWLLVEHRAVMRGEVLGTGEPILHSPMTHVYVTVPTQFPDEFARLQEATGEIIFAWVIPVTAAEAEFVRPNGWSEFEDRLELSEVDLFTLDRSSAV